MTATHENYSFLVEQKTYLFFSTRQEAESKAADLRKADPDKPVQVFTRADFDWYRED